MKNPPYIAASAALWAVFLCPPAQAQAPHFDMLPTGRSAIVSAIEREAGAASEAGAAMLADARRFLGSRNPTGTRGPWCRDFVNFLARRNGVPLLNTSRRAVDAKHLGARVRHPAPGDLVVMASHVTLYAGRAPDGRIRGLGGNQGGGRVTVSHYHPARVLAFVRIGA